VSKTRTKEVFGEAETNVTESESNESEWHEREQLESGKYRRYVDEIKESSTASSTAGSRILAPPGTEWDTHGNYGEDPLLETPHGLRVAASRTWIGLHGCGWPSRWLSTAADKTLAQYRAGLGKYHSRAG